MIRQCPHCLCTVDIPDMTKDTQKKSKRKGRNKQEVLTINQAEPEPETVKTPIDLLKVTVKTTANDCQSQNVQWRHWMTVMFFAGPGDQQFILWKEEDQICQSVCQRRSGPPCDSPTRTACLRVSGTKT